MKLREATVTTYQITNTMLGAITFLALNCAGSAGASTFTVKDGTDIKFVFSAGVTQQIDKVFGGVAFSNFNVTNSGTASYSVVFRPRP